MNDVTEYCSIKEASQMLGVSPKTVQLWVEKGSLRAWKTAGGHRRVIRESVNALIKARNQQADSNGVSGSVHREPGMHVLIVEDEEALRRLYEFNVRQWASAIQVDSAKDGFEALLRIGKTKPDVMITDLSMPGMDGFKMLRRLSELGELGSMLVIVVTSYDSEAIQNLGRLPDGVHVFEKPAPFKSIRQLVMDAMSEKRPLSR
ncbi:MAG: response regulator [Limnobacter sp.]|uniref:response regulator n=1 Tax=Limnobacter sp. TaxID=2003368 RepID=UPI0032ED6FE8